MTKVVDCSWWGGCILFFILYLIEGGSIVFLAIWERRHHFLGNFGEEAPFYWVNWGGGLKVFYV